jgi:hypothetical protein
MCRHVDNKPGYYFPALAAVSKQKLDQDPSARWVVQFHPLVTQSINALTYRQYNYHQMMSHSTQLARWLYKQLSLKYTFANYDNSFSIQYSRIKRDSAMINYTRERDGISAVDNAFQELQGHSVISRFAKEYVRGPRRKIADVLYVLYPSVEFVREMKAANKRGQGAVSSDNKRTLPARPQQSKGQ